MKRVYYSFLIVLFCIVCFPAKAFAEENRSVQDFKTRGASGDFPRSWVELHQEIDKSDENGQFLSGVQFKLSTYNNVYSATSNERGDYYLVNSSYTDEHSFQKAYGVLSNEQKSKLNEVTTLKELREQFGNNNFACSSMGSDSQSGIPVGYYCYFILPSVYYLEETEVPVGYSQEKVILPALVDLLYRIVDYDQANPNPNCSIELTAMQISDAYIGKFFKYGTINESRLVGVDLGAVEQIWMQEGRNTCGYSHEPMTPVKSVGASSYRTVCLVNQKGIINLEVNSYVEDQQEITTGINSNIRYKIYVTNTGTLDAVNSKVQAKLPEGFAYVNGSANNNGHYENGVITWDIGRIEKNTSITLMYQAYAPEGTKSGNYVGEVTAENAGIQGRIESNKTVVKLSLVNPATIAPVGVVILIVLLVIEIIVVLLQHRMKPKKKA